MYHITNIKTGEKYYLGRPDKSLQQVCDEFENDLLNELKTISQIDRLKFVKDLKKLNRLFEQPSLNYNTIRGFFDDTEYRFPFQKYYNLSSQKNFKNETAKAIPELFENPNVFPRFVFAVAGLLSITLYQLKEDNKIKKDKPSCRAIGYKILFERLAKGEVRELKDIFRDLGSLYGREPNSLKVAYHKIQAKDVNFNRVHKKDFMAAMSLLNDNASKKVAQDLLKKSSE